MKQFPSESTASSTSGITYVFHDDEVIIRVWLSTMTGKEKVYANEDLVLEKRNVTRFKTVDTFQYKGVSYEMEILTKMSMGFEIRCFILKEGKVIGGQICEMDGMGNLSIFEDSNLKEAKKRAVDRYRMAAYKQLQEYDLPEAAQLVDQLLQANPQDPEGWLYRACIASLEERAHDCYDALGQALAYQLTGKDRILSMDYLAYIRIHPDFQSFREEAGL